MAGLMQTLSHGYLHIGKDRSLGAESIALDAADFHVATKRTFRRNVKKADSKAGGT